MQITRVALFDFCETLVNFQTADSYVYYVLEKSKSKFSQRWIKFYDFLKKCKIIFLLEYFSRWRYSINKRMILMSLKGFKETELQALACSYYYDRIRPNFINTVLGTLKQKKTDGYRVYIVSGGYDIYLKYFVEEFELDGLLSTRIAFKNGECLGRFDGKDCLSQQKIKYLNEVLIQKPDYSESYSDSISDLPLLTWTTEGFVISKYQSQKWALDNKLNEIIWK